MKEQELLSWFEQSARLFLERNAKERLAALENDYERLKRLLLKSDKVTICFLGNSGVGKSTLLNAIVAGNESVLPAGGGNGPMTAQATEVHYSEVPYFKVTYHPREYLWKVAFRLETRLSHQQKPAKKDQKKQGGEKPIEDQDSDFHVHLDQEALKDALADALHLSDYPDDQIHDPMEGLIKQVKQIITGDQFSNKSLPYLVDALRTACNYKPRWQISLDEEDIKRIEHIKQILKPEKEDRILEVRQGENLKFFRDNMRAHAAGFLSPLIERIEVGWPCEILKSGVILVDLPGVGIAQDSYRNVTKSYIREKARAVIMVVDSRGPTEETVDLLRSSGYWDRLVGAADDPESDPCSMLIAVTRVDDVASEEWRNIPDDNTSLRPKKREVFTRLVEEFKPHLRNQINDQLGKIGSSDNESVGAAREQARNNILQSLQIHPVSAPEFRKILLDDEDDRSFLQHEKQTGVPALQQSLVQLAQAERENINMRIQDVYQRFSSSLLNDLYIIEGQWREKTRAAEEAERLADALELILDPKRKEYHLRGGAFREFLEETVKAKIRELVLEAKIVAEAEVNSYLRSLREAHWATLRAAVRRGGCFYGSRAINLPDDITNYFQEPMAAVWGQKLLKDIRERTSILSSDIAAMVEEICIWANHNGGAQINEKLLDNQKARIASLAAQMKQVGKEAVDELREVVKLKLKESIRRPIELACEQFIQSGNDYGSGVKQRILELFDQLAAKATKNAQQPAIEILQSNFLQVREEINAAFQQWGDPIQETADLIVERHEERVKRSDAQKRGRILAELEEVFSKNPIQDVTISTETT